MKSGIGECVELVLDPEIVALNGLCCDSVKSADMSLLLVLDNDTASK
jgi:hypothetical protein